MSFLHTDQSTLHHKAMELKWHCLEKLVLAAAHPPSSDVEFVRAFAAGCVLR